ncbi:hypothetical protein [Paraburkholderia sp. D1E]|uniref:hypothetical protein n=1 Tax=Paraburkholderia sp. D1E TaxID=3461398 RepID=UPI004045AE6A
MGPHESASRWCFPCSFEHRNLPDVVWTFPVRLIFLEREMLKLLLKDATKTPWKLLALCLVVYLATLSLVVFIFVAFLAGHWLRKTIQQKTKALEAAEAKRAEAATPVVPAAPAVATVTPANPAVAPAAAQPAPKRQYAKSAVVIPFRTGTRN